MHLTSSYASVGRDVLCYLKTQKMFLFLIRFHIFVLRPDQMFVLLQQLGTNCTAKWLYSPLINIVFKHLRKNTYLKVKS